MTLSETSSRELWDNLHRASLIVKRKFQFPFLEFKTGMRVLDVGCGSGSDLEYLKFELELECFGLDIAIDKALKDGRRKEIIFLLADASHLPFKENVFDIVYSFGTIEHTQRTFESVRESFRVLKQGGQVLHTVPNVFSLHSLFARPLLRALKKWHLGLEKSFTVSKFHKMFRRNGFDRITYHTLPFNPHVASKQFSSLTRSVYLFKTLDNVIGKLIPFWGFFIVMGGRKRMNLIARLSNLTSNSPS